jgi:8-oxo-dGTP pyrophosphatase MutT (NUDIX family)
MDPAPHPLIQAAGGLLWSRGLLALIHRSRYGDWTLPKGKLQPGESWESAALREVREETGYRTRLLTFAGAVAYETGKGPKLVRFWNMEPAGPDPEPFDASEVAEVVWLPPAEACQKLSYAVERALVESAALAAVGK